MTFTFLILYENWIFPCMALRSLLAIEHFNIISK